MIPDPPRPDAPSDANAKPSAAPSAGYEAIADGPARKREDAPLPGYGGMSDGPSREPSRNREDTRLARHVGRDGRPTRTREDTRLARHVATEDRPARKREDATSRVAKEVGATSKRAGLPDGKRAGLGFLPYCRVGQCGFPSDVLYLWFVRT